MKRANTNNEYSSKRKRFDVEFLTHQFVKQINSESASSERFKLCRHYSTYVFSDIDHFPNPEAELERLFGKCVGEAISNSAFTPDSIGCIISSARLNNDIEIPIRDISANTVEAILNRFLKVQQSKSEEASLYGAPFTIKITTVARKCLPKRRELKGKGRVKDVKHNIQRKCLFPINNNDNLCLIYACELVRIHEMKIIRPGDTPISPKEFYNFKENQQKQRANVLRVMSEAKIPKNLPDYDAETFLPLLQAYYDRKYGTNLIKIFVFNDYGLYKPIYMSTESNDFTYPVCVYLHNQHFDGIRTLSGFFNRRYYCLHCLSPYSHKFEHRTVCIARCNNCSGVGVDFPCKPDANFRPKECLHCSKIFLNDRCYNRHIGNGFCGRSKLCRKCGVIWNVRYNVKDGRRGHVCAEKHCSLCSKYHNPEKGCHIQKYAVKKPDPYRIVFFDFETDQSEKCQNGTERFEHRVNFISAKIVCTKCIESGEWSNKLEKKCKICGKYRSRTWAPFEFSQTEVGKATKTSNPLRKFVKWLREGLDSRYKTICLSHFGGRFDMTFIFREFFQAGITPDMIRQGNRLYEMKIKKTSENPELVFHDSYNLVPRPLSDLVGAFDLKIESKAFFPHLYNKTSNYDTILPTLPARELYLHTSMKPETKEKFERWYTENFNTSFALNEKLAEYCCNDTTILMHAMVALRKTFFELTRKSAEKSAPGADSVRARTVSSPSLQTDSDSDSSSSNDAKATNNGQEGIDIIHTSMTIASACMKNYRFNHLRENQLAIVPEKGYDHMENQSLLALKFFQFYEEVHNVDVQTALSDGGEKQIGSYHLDGFIQRPGERKDLGLEVNGCYFHACRRCYPNDQQILAQGKTAAFIRQRDAKRLQFLRQLIDVEIFWECDIREQLKTDSEMKHKFENYIDNGPIQLRDAYFGGRTGPAKLFHKVEPGYKISYKDFTSLYPFTNYTTNYPVGHPRTIIFKTSEQDVDWRHPSDNPHTGILKVLVDPPRKIDVAVLPTRFDDRLLFPLCRKCSMEHPEGARATNYSCTHSDDERAFVSTCTHIELNEALAQGYRVRKKFRVLEYEEWDDTLFKSYVSDLMAVKTQASGFPDGVTSEREDAFIDECYEKFGIRIDRTRMASNPAMKTLAKLMLNSLWGRFSLRNTLSKTVVTDCPAKLRELLDDTKLEVSSLDMLNDEVLLITYGVKLEFIEEHDCSNIVISLWTTSAARLVLLKALQSVARTPDCQILYHDTDSIVYVHPIDNDPLPTGAHLGELTDEYPRHTIVEFVSGGCKNYALKLKNNTTGMIEYSLKVRGITLDFNACKMLHYDSFLDKVLAYVLNEEDELPIVINYSHFLRPDLRAGTVFTAPMNKIYRPVVTKGVVGPDFIVHNFGEKIEIQSY